MKPSGSAITILLLTATAVVLALSGSGEKRGYFRGIESLTGFMVEEEANPSDSVIDLTEVSKYGIPQEWRYHYPDNATTVEDRVDHWLSFTTSTDTLLLNHAESSREQRNFHIETGGRPGASSRQPYLSDSRRDMSFQYTDSGRVELRKFITPVLVLAPGDTMRDIRAEQLTLRYLRRKAPVLTPDSTAMEDPDITVDSTLFLPGPVLEEREESETRWFAGATRIPLAVAVSTLTAREDGDTVRTARTYTFPEGLNPERAELAYASPEEKKIEKGEKGEKGENGKPDPRHPGAEIGEPRISIEGTILRMSGMKEARITLCDIAGRVLLPITPLREGDTLDLSHLGSGEYVIGISGADGTQISSQTLILQK